MNKILKNRLERIEILIERGYTGNIETGKVYNRLGKEVKTKDNEYLAIGSMFKNKTFKIKQHQFIWYLATGEVIDNIDHRNGNGFDNRIINLRSVTHQQNHFNETKAKGYSLDKRNNKWKTYIAINGKQIWLGYYDTELEAHKVYLEAKEKYHKIN